MGDGIERLHEADCRGPQFDSPLVAFLVNHFVRRKMICCLVRASESATSMAETWDDWEREVTLWTDFFRSKASADTSTTTGQRVSAISTSLRRRPLNSKGGPCEDDWYGESVHSVASLWLCAERADRHRSETAEMLGPSMRH